MKRFGLGAGLICGFLGLGLAGGAAKDAIAQAGGPSGKRPMTFTDLMAMKRVSDPQISPSGKWVLFSVTDVSLEKNTKVNHLWVVPLGGGAGSSEKQIPSGNGRQNGAGADASGEWQLTF